MSDADGRFAFTNLEFGEYILRAQREGYVALAPPGGDPQAIAVKVILDPSTLSADVNLNMFLPAVIRGRVLDFKGNPVAGVEVQAVDGRDSGNFVVTLSVTDDHGQYRLFGLPPGKYYIAAKIAGKPLSNLPSKIFYGTNTKSSEPDAVVAGEGDEVSTIDFLLPPGDD
jgi:hypothetical protein